MNHKMKRAKIYWSEKKLSVVILKLETRLKTKAPEGRKNRTSDAICWNFAAKGRNRASPLPFPPLP